MVHKSERKGEEENGKMWEGGREGEGDKEEGLKERGREKEMKIYELTFSNGSLDRSGR